MRSTSGVSFTVIMLILFIVIFVLLIVVPLVLIATSGLFPALTLFLLSAIFLLILHFLKAVDLKKQPLLIIIPFLFLGVGYIGTKFQTISMFLTNTTHTTVSPLPLLIFLLIIIAAFLYGRKRR